MTLDLKLVPDEDAPMTPDEAGQLLGIDLASVPDDQLIELMQVLYKVHKDFEQRWNVAHGHGKMIQDGMILGQLCEKFQRIQGEIVARTKDVLMPFLCEVLGEGIKLEPSLCTLGWDGDDFVDARFVLSNSEQTPPNLGDFFTRLQEVLGTEVVLDTRRDNSVSFKVRIEYSNWAQVLAKAAEATTAIPEVRRAVIDEVALPPPIPIFRGRL